jgi:hypothetical protein
MGSARIDRHMQPRGDEGVHEKEDARAPDNPEKKKKQTVAQFLAAASEMDQGDWERGWRNACKSFSKSARDARGHGIPSDSAEQFLSDSLRTSVDAIASRDDWSPASRRIWEVAVPFLAKAWDGALDTDRAKKFGSALNSFSEQGDCEIDISSSGGSDSARRTLNVSSGSLKLIEESSEEYIPVLKTQLEEQNLPYEYTKRDVAHQPADGRRLIHHLEFKLSARVG